MAAENDARNDRGPLAGGCLICVAILAGTIVGLWQGQSSIGILAGLGIGLVLAILLWAWDRKKS
jgi:uncharacterized membrane protein (UPF0136 family)